MQITITLEIKDVPKGKEAQKTLSEKLQLALVSAVEDKLEQLNVDAGIATAARQ